MKQRPSETLFLALTALEDFWDKSQPILFLGQWCQPFDDMFLLKEKMKIHLLNHSDLVDQNPDQAYHYTFQVYEILLPQIANWLNQIHGADHSLKYWRIVIGSFLLFYIQVTYHRWNALKIAISSYVNLRTIGLAETSYLTPINTLEFALFAAESDIWNHQLMTQILNLISFDMQSYQDYTWDKELKQRQSLFGKKLSYKKITKIIIKLISLLTKLRGFNIIGLYGPAGWLATKKDFFKVFLLSKFRILPLLGYRDVERAATERPLLNMLIRESLSTLVATDDFSRIVLETLKINFPINFIEHYQEEIQKIDRCFPFSPRIVLGGWILNDKTAIWGAKLSEQGSMLVSTQHGGGYGILNLSSYEALEKANSDVFISWGWKDMNNNVLPAPSVYFPELKEIRKQQNHKKNRNSFILWPTTDIMRYTVHFTSVALTSREYFDWQEQFLSNLESKVSNKIIMRLRPNSKYQAYIKKKWNTLNVQCPHDNESFFKQLSRAKIIISDNINTTFLYALACNIPTILFWDKNAWKIREEAKPYFKALQQVGIYHDSPKSAAEMLNKVFDNPNKWWTNKSLQLARQIFCDNYAKMSPDGLRNWVDMLLNLSTRMSILSQN